MQYVKENCVQKHILRWQSRISLKDKTMKYSTITKFLLFIWLLTSCGSYSSLTSSTRDCDLRSSDETSQLAFIKNTNNQDLLRIQSIFQQADFCQLRINNKQMQVNETVLQVGVFDQRDKERIKARLGKLGYHDLTFISKVEFQDNG